MLLFAFRSQKNNVIYRLRQQIFSYRHCNNNIIFISLHQLNLINLIEMEGRKPKGSEGGSLQIRDLDADTLDKLRELQQHFGVGTSSKAVLLAIRDFMKYKNEIQSLRLQLLEANRKISVQAAALRSIVHLVDDFKFNEYD